LFLKIFFAESRLAPQHSVLRGFEVATSKEAFADPAVLSALCREFPPDKGVAKGKVPFTESILLSAKAAFQ
jgi:hypothetical protein